MENGRRLRARFVVMVAGVLFAATVAGATPPDPEFDWHGLGGCLVPVVGMPTDFANVAPYIPPGEHAKVIRTGPAGDQAGLLFVFIRCPENKLDTARGMSEASDVIQVMVGVLYQSARPEDLDKAQFYLLASAINWTPFVTAEKRLGFPSEHVKKLQLDVVRDETTGLGTFTVSVPQGRAALSVAGQILAPNPNRDHPQDAVHFLRGPHGLVRVHHDESWALGNEAIGTITAPAGSPIATWMGATAREAIGVYVWIHDHLHVHKYRIVDPEPLAGATGAPTLAAAPGAAAAELGSRRR